MTMIERARSVLAGFGLALVAGCSSGTETPKARGAGSALENPFWKQDFGSADTDVECPGATGPRWLPRRGWLSEAEARPTIVREFARAGLRLQADQAIREDGVCFEIDGVTKDRKIGYEWVGPEDEERVADTQPLRVDSAEPGSPDPRPSRVRERQQKLFEQCLAMACKKTGWADTISNDPALLERQQERLQAVFHAWAMSRWTFDVPDPPGVIVLRPERETGGGVPPVEESRVLEWLDWEFQSLHKRIAESRKRLNLEEAKLIRRRAEERKYFYALIQSGYYSYEMEPYDPRVPYDHPKPWQTAGALERLHKDVRQFIEWARSHGAY